MKDHLEVRILFLDLDEAIPSVDIGPTVATLTGQGIRQDLIVPKIHEKCEFVIDSAEIKGGHITHHALERAIHVQPLEKVVWIDLEGIPGFLVTIVPGFADDAGRFTTFMCIRVGHFPLCIEEDLGIEPAIAMGRIFPVIIPEQLHIVHKPYKAFRRMLKTLLPLIEAAPVHPDDRTDPLDGKVKGKLKNYFVFLFFKEMYSLFCPSPFTSYPFFARRMFACARISALISSSFVMAW